MVSSRQLRPTGSWLSYQPRDGRDPTGSCVRLDIYLPGPTWAGSFSGSLSAWTRLGRTFLWISICLDPTGSRSCLDLCLWSTRPRSAHLSIYVSILSTCPSINQPIWFSASSAADFGTNVGLLDLYLEPSVSLVGSKPDLSLGLLDHYLDQVSGRIYVATRSTWGFCGVSISLRVCPLCIRLARRLFARLSVADHLFA